jgi:hypothetical protein
MTKKSSETNKSAELGERVELKGRENRGVVISIRITASEAQRVAARAESEGLSVSEYARRAVLRSLSTSWMLKISNGQGPLIVGAPPHTGGDYGRRSEWVEEPARR